MSDQMTDHERMPLLSVRATLVLLLAVLAGAAAGVLTYLAGQPVAAAILAGGASMGAATTLFHTIIGR